MEQEDTEAEGELDKDFVSKIRAAFDMPEEVISKEPAPLWERVNFDELNRLLESLRENRRNSKEHEDSAADRSYDQGSKHHNTVKLILRTLYDCH